MEYLIGFVAGVVMYAIVLIVTDCRRSAWGTLRINYSDPNKDVYSINVDNLECLNNKKRVVLIIKHEDDLSQK
jgi:hypothetical protein